VNHNDVGHLGEKIAQDYLKKLGHKILETNKRSSIGEIDIVSSLSNCLVFTEVRCKRSLAFGAPEESITRAKKKKMIATAQSYVQHHQRACTSWRIDFIAIEIDSNNQVTRIEHYENAIGE
jgi:putative endonuclease